MTAFGAAAFQGRPYRCALGTPLPEPASCDTVAACSGTRDMGRRGRRVGLGFKVVVLEVRPMSGASTPPTDESTLIVASSPSHPRARTSATQPGPLIPKEPTMYRKIVLAIAAATLSVPVGGAVVGSAAFGITRTRSVSVDQRHKESKDTSKDGSTHDTSKDGSSHDTSSSTDRSAG
jgi:hypothetical protein